MRVTRALCLLLAGAVAAAPAPGVHAQASPRHPLRILVPLPPGSTSDVVARLIGEQLGEYGGSPVVVDNRAGASGRIAVEALKASAADGSTLPSAEEEWNAGFRGSEHHLRRQAPPVLTLGPTTGSSPA